MDIAINGKNLLLNNSKVEFNFPVRQFKSIGEDVAVVLLGIPNDSNELDNIYALDKNGKTLWRVQSIKEAFPEMKNIYPFEQMFLKDNELSATDFYGRRFCINIETGELYKKDTFK